MRLEFIELRNYRKLKSTRIDFDEKRTLFVGANNSGKTSAMLALRTFLGDTKKLTLRDVSIANWAALDLIGEAWEADGEPANTFAELLPSLDLWLDVPASEIHHVVHIIPTIDWASGLLGVRLQYDIDNEDQLKEHYLEARNKAQIRNKKAEDGRPKPQIRPESLTDFLDGAFRKYLTVNCFPLDPVKNKTPKPTGAARPQLLPEDTLPLDDRPFANLIKVDEIPASPLEQSDSSGDTSDGSAGPRLRRRLSDQVRSYYDRHLDNADDLSPDDIAALGSIYDAEQAFDGRLKSGFEGALDELAELNVPGVHNPSIAFNTQLRGEEGLKHGTAIQYQVSNPASSGDPVRHLPESYAGLGYQRLISMIFLLMQFRQDWTSPPATISINAAPTPLIHLVLIEEPEAHLHAQVQQVFINKAYDVLRNHPRLGNKTDLTTQMIVSTHSSHVAHEVDFANLRYFRRHPSDTPGSAPTTTVANLSNVFGEDEETERFVKRYLKSTDCDLFFADGAIFVEGQAERILVPHFIRHHFPSLWRRYTSLIDLGGAHAHRLEPLVRTLGLTVLVISDLDAAQPTQITKSDGVKTKVNRAAKPSVGNGQVTSNAVLKKWHPKKTKIDELVSLPADGHEVRVEEAYDLFVAFQKAVPDPTGANNASLIPRTFEDAIVYANFENITCVTGGSTTTKIAKLVETGLTGEGLEAELFELLRSAEKASFALDCLLAFDNPETLQPPPYISSGLAWLDAKLASETNTVLKKNEVQGG
ncbi:AAA family ATPase [Boseongicola sp. H5]|uniref:ATP-dependent nuclease n=1 Tax=Boseongicola sp. H5 TaxID=2763261 RepID=UPI001D0ABDE2|nr:AAA family ATPase [Boseongicola sp. H5]